MKTPHTNNLVSLLTAVLLAGCGGEPVSQSVQVVGDYRYAAAPAGRDSPAGQCVVCHSLEQASPLRVAPTLWGIVGDSKARFDWYGYSEALATAGGNWTEEDLDAYLTDPDKFLPGTTKTLVGIEDPDERSELIRFLATLRD